MRTKIIPYVAFVFLFVLAFSCNAFAAEAQGGFQAAPPAAGGGFSGPGASASTVEQALAMRDDALVVLRGNIVRQVTKDIYLFQDATGSMHVEIDHDKWGGQNVSPSDLVEILGEIDKDWNSVKVEVQRIIKVR